MGGMRQISDGGGTRRLPQEWALPSTRSLCSDASPRILGASSDGRYLGFRAQLGRRLTQRLARADRELLQFDDKEEEDSAADEPGPNPKRQRLVAEDRMERGGAGGGEVQ